LEELNEVLHRIRVKLYPNYLPQAEGKYIARTNNEALLSIEQALRRLVKHIAIEVEGLADCNAYIDEFTDTDEKSTNKWFLPDNVFVLAGNLIKLAGDNPALGCFLFRLTTLQRR
jgi:hypothetical protein